MRRDVLVSVVVVLGCQGAGTIPDGPVGEQGPFPNRCAELHQQIVDEVTVRGTCDGPGDCAVLGGQNGFPTCNCAPFVLACGGFAIERNAPGVATAPALIEAYWRTCDGDPWLPELCDCAPIEVECVMGRCVGRARSCLVPPDAGVPDAFIPDAP